MARTARNAKIDTPSARSKLAFNKSGYWIAIAKGRAFGYRKGAKGGRWVARMIEDGKRQETFISTADDMLDADGVTVLDFSQAQEAARKWFLSEVRKEHGDHVARGNYTVADAMRDYIQHYAVEGKAVADMQSNVNAHILPALGKIELTRLTTKKIGDWHHELASGGARLRTAKSAKEAKKRPVDSNADAIRRRRATANRILTRLKAALNYAWKQGKVASDASWRKIKPFKNVDAPVVRYLTEAECLRIVNACPEDFRKMVKAALFTGCRYSELATLKVADYNPDAGTVAIRTSKSGKPRHVVLSEEAKTFFETMTVGKESKDIIFTHKNGSSWGRSHQSKPLADACIVAKITPAVSFHVLRHTHGSLLAMQGVPMPVIAQQLGHADTRMTEKHYAHLSPSYVADTIRQHFPTLRLSEDTKIEAFKAKKNKGKVLKIIG
jgi:integrase